MKQIIRLLPLLFCLAFIKASAEDITSSVDSLSNGLYRKSNKYTERGIEYRVVKKVVINEYFNNIKTIDKAKSEQIDLYHSKIDELNQINEDHTLSYNELNEKYEYSIKANDSMAFMGIFVPKTTYNLMMWGLVFTLIAIGLILLLMYNRSHKITRTARQELAETNEEYESFRKRSLKREQEVASSYQREINKLKGNLS